RQERTRQEMMSRSNAAVQAQINSRSKHVGNTYVYNPKGRAPEREYSTVEIWFYPSPPQILPEYDYGSASTKKERFRPTDLTRFKVVDVVVTKCGVTRSFLDETCYYYKVELGNVAAYLEAGRKENDLATKLDGTDTLSFVSVDEGATLLMAMP